MAHLGADLAAYVDGQLPERSMDEARRHLESCSPCRTAVRQQQALKSRMRGVEAPVPPPTLLAALADVEHLPAARCRPWRRRVLGSTVLRATSAIAGACLVVAGIAFVVGGTDKGPGDPVTPPMDRFEAQFAASSAGAAPTDPIDYTAMAELEDSGWPCHASLGGDLRRESGQLTDGDQVVNLVYSNASQRLSLFEQNGRLDVDTLQGFVPQKISDAKVWVREGSPSIVTWDDDNGVVYTVVTDADRDRIARVVAQLPTRRQVDGSERVAEGLDKMTTWLSPTA